jgi:hypothetical protein
VELIKHFKAIATIAKKSAYRVDYRRWNQAYATIANTITKTIAYSVIF